MSQEQLILYFTIGIVFALAMVVVVYYMLYRFKKEADIRHFLMNTILINHKFLKEITNRIETDTEENKYEFPEELLEKMKAHNKSIEENLPKSIVD